MQAVKYARASSVDEAVTLLRDGGETARVLAGGTDVIVQARERRRHIELFVDIKHIPELTSLTHDGGGGLYTRDYLGMFQNCGMTLCDHGNGITYEDFSKGYAIWVFDVTRD